MAKTELETVMSDGVDLVRNRLDASPQLRQELALLHKQNQEPWVITIGLGYEVFLELRKYKPE